MEWSRVGYGREEPSKERKVDKGRIEEEESRAKEKRRTPSRPERSSRK